MPNHRMFLLINLVSIFLLSVFSSSCQAGSMTSWHQITNKTQEELFVTLFEGYPVNRSYSKLLKAGEMLDVKDDIPRPGYYYVISVTKNYKKNTETVLRKMFNWIEYTGVLQNDKVDGFHITEERLQTWDHDPK